MNIIDTATVTALIAVVAFAVLAVLVATGIGIGHLYAASPRGAPRPYRPSRGRRAARPFRPLTPSPPGHTHPGTPRQPDPSPRVRLL